MTFRDAEKKRYQAIKRDLFSVAACENGHYRETRRVFCLDDGHSEENLHVLLRDDAIEYFRVRGINWHDGIANRPSNHLCCSQCFCVNSLWPLVRNPDLLTKVFRPFFPEVAEALPFDEDGLLGDGRKPFLAFEWIGKKNSNYLGEHRNRKRGANATSADFAFRFRRFDGRVQLVLGEWKYTESYGKKIPDPKELNKTQLDIYREAFNRWPKPFSDFPHYHVEPFYQLMRLTLLAQEMERSRIAGDGEMRADIVSVLHVLPNANHELAEGFKAAPSLARYGRTVTQAWTGLAPRERFLAISTESLLSVIEQGIGNDLREWSDYLLRRYGWWRTVQAKSG